MTDTTSPARLDPGRAGIHFGSVELVTVNSSAHRARQRGPAGVHRGRVVGAGFGRRPSISRRISANSRRATHFQMRTLKNVASEMALHVLAYNLKRVMNILGIGPLIAAMKAV